MAQKSAKSLATRNTARLKQTHLTTLGINVVFLLISLTLRTSLSLTRWILLCLPAFGVEFWLEKISRPTYSSTGDLVRAGEDLDAPGLTEFMWDIIYWTWLNIAIVLVFGNRGWWAMMVVPLYGAYAAFGAARGLKGALGGMVGQASPDEGQSAGVQSKRAAKMEARGGQKIKYSR